MKKTLLFLLFINVSFVFAQAKKSYDIGILVDHRPKELNPVLLQLETQIKTVVGEDATINFLEKNILANNFNLEKAKQNYEQLIQNETDIILAFGVVNNELITKLSTHQKPTILFGAINSDFNSINLNKKTSETPNFTYLIESESYLDDLKIFQELTHFKTVGFVIDAPFVDILPIKKILDKSLQSLGVNYKLIPFKTLTDITSNLDGIDAVYIAGGFFLKENEVRTLAETFVAKKLPSFSINGIDHVKLGIMATNQSEDNFEQLMRRIALTVDAYINGTPLAEMPISIDYDKRLTINYNVTELVGVPIKYSLIATTDFVGEFKNAQSKKTYNLKTLINDVLAKNLSLKSSQKSVALNQQNVKSAKSNYLPSLSATATGTYLDPKIASVGNAEFSTAGNITLQQTIYSASASANVTVQEHLEKAQQETYNAEQLTTIFNAANAYFNTLILKTNAEIQLRNLNLTKRNLQIANQNFKAGQKGKTDVLRFRSQMAQNTQAMVLAANQLEQGFIGINQLLNNPVDNDIDIEEVTLDKGIFKQYNYNLLAQLLDDPLQREPFIEFLIEEAKRNAPELKALDYNLKATTRNIKLSGSQRFLPTVALQGTYNRTFSRSGAGSVPPPGVAFVNGNYNVGLNVSIPIFNRNQNNINKQTAMIQKDQLEINRQNSELNIAANVRNGVLNLINQISNIELSKVSEATAKESLSLTQASYANGAVNIVQLIDAQNNYLNAQLAKANAVYNFLINSLQLERYIGYYFLLNSEADNNQFRQRFLTFLNTKN